MVPHGVHIVHTCTMEIKSMMSEHMYMAWLSRLSKVDFVHFLFYFFSFSFSFIFYFLFLEQPRLGVISHAVTSVTT